MIESCFTSSFAFTVLSFLLLSFACLSCNWLKNLTMSVSNNSTLLAGLSYSVIKILPDDHDQIIGSMIYAVMLSVILLSFNNLFV